MLLAGLIIIHFADKTEEALTLPKQVMCCFQGPVLFPFHFLCQPGALRALQRMAKVMAESFANRDDSYVQYGIACNHFD